MAERGLPFIPLFLTDIRLYKKYRRIRFITDTPVFLLYRNLHQIVQAPQHFYSPVCTLSIRPSSRRKYSRNGMLVRKVRISAAGWAA